VVIRSPGRLSPQLLALMLLACGTGLSSDAFSPPVASAKQSPPRPITASSQSQLSFTTPQDECCGIDPVECLDPVRSRSSTDQSLPSWRLRHKRATVRLSQGRLNKSSASKNKASATLSAPNQSANTNTRQEEQHLERLEGWATKYTNVETLRSEFGSNKNKLWGDLDSVSSRKLYHVLLPRALLGLHELGVMDLEDLAPLAYEARVAAKQYARERCAVPGRLGAMLFDGWRQWRSYGKFNPKGMSWDQIWAKYETQLLQDYDDFHKHDVDDMDDMDDERLTRDICLKILERSCITNDKIDRLFSSSSKSSSLSSSSSNKGRLQKEHDIKQIARKLDQDVQHLLQVQTREISSDSNSAAKKRQRRRSMSAHEIYALRFFALTRRKLRDLGRQQQEQQEQAKTTTNTHALEHQHDSEKKETSLFGSAVPSRSRETSIRPWSNRMPPTRQK
jgi:hypothetical protein